MSVIQVEEKKVEVGKVLCVGRNYVEHIHELDNAIPEQMVVFNKPSTSVSTILRSFHQEPLHYEAEICFLIKDGQYAAVGLGLDLTKRGLQSSLKSKACLGSEQKHLMALQFLAALCLLKALIFMTLT